MVEFPEKIKAYISKVEKETGLPVIIEEVKDVGLSGMKERTRYYPDKIHIEITPKTFETLEHSIPHELTHGLLWHKRGYSPLKLRLSIPLREQTALGILNTMLEDIVVNRIIHEEGFEAFSAIYLEMVQKETKFIIRGRDIYADFQDPTIKEKFMIFRYIIAWGFMEYFDLGIHTRRVLAKFMRTFQRFCPHQYELAKEVEKVIRENDIFTAQGYLNALKGILRIWNLESFVIPP